MMFLPGSIWEQLWIWRKRSQRTRGPRNRTHFQIFWQTDEFMK